MFSRSSLDSGDLAYFASATAIELIVADGSCPQIRELLTAADAPVLWLDDQEPALETVSRVLTERRTLGQPVDTLHWVSHGSPGQLQLGASRINNDTLLANAHSLANWDLSRLALWSCQAGADHNFIALWEELTGATVWSTASLLGRLEDGSSHWTLTSQRAVTASIWPALPINPAQRQAWPGQTWAMPCHAKPCRVKPGRARPCHAFLPRHAMQAW